MKYLGNNQFEIQNDTTGETKVVTGTDLPSYGLSVPSWLPGQGDKGGILSSLVKSSIKPFAETGRNIVGAALQTPLMIAQGGLEAGATDVSQPTFLRNIARKGADIYGTGAKTLEPIGLQQGEMKDIAANPGKAMKKQMKRNAAIISWGVPFGKGANFVTKATLPGAAVGALQGISEENATPESVLRSTGIGAGGATAIYGLSKIPEFLSKAGQKFENAADRLDQGTRKINLRGTITSAGREKAINDTLDRTVGRGSAQKQLEQLSPAMDKLEQKISDFITENPDISIGNKELKRAFLDKLQSSVRSGDLTNAQAVKEVNRYLGDLLKASGASEKAGAISLEQLRGLKKLINEDYGPVYEAMQRGGSLSPKQKVIAVAWESLDKAIQGVAPEVKKLLLDESNLYAAAPKLAAARFNPPTLRGLGSSLPASVTQAGRDIISTVAQAGGKAMQVPGGIQAPNDIISNLAGNIAGQVGSRALLPGPQPSTSPPLESKTISQTDETGYIFDPQTQQWSYEPKDTSIQMPNMDNFSLPQDQGQADVLGSQSTNLRGAGLPSADDFKLAIWKDVQRTGGQNFAKLQSLYKFFYPEENVKKDPQTVRAIQEATQGLGLVNVLRNKYQTIQRKGMTASGPGLGLLGGLYGQTRASALVQDKDARSYNDAVSAFMSRLSRAAGERGVLTDIDIQRIQKAIPSFYDAPDTAEEKWATINALIGNAISTAESSGLGNTDLTQQGY